MKAIGFTKSLSADHPDSLVDLNLPNPAAAGRDLLVRIEAVSVNPIDTKIRRRGDQPEPKILGFDASGTIEAVGPEVTLFRPGDAVFYAGSVVRPGTNSEYHLVDERIVGRKPAKLTYAEAAALPLVSITAWELFFDRIGIDAGGRDAGKHVLIIGGAGGVGSIAIQLAKWAGLTVTATASRPETVAWVKILGADYVIDHRQPLPPQAFALGIKEYDFIANLVDTDGYWEATIELIKPQGRIGALVDAKVPLDLNPLKHKSAGFVWEQMFIRSTFTTPDIQKQHDLLGKVADLIDAGTLRAILTETFAPINAANLRAAHLRLESGTTIGKIALAGFPQGI
ncbi:MAG TPA: zinc-binding alcohol dehydrogenase family protein [Chthoniobacterales bacterium]